MKLRIAPSGPDIAVFGPPVTATYTYAEGPAELNNFDGANFGNVDIAKFVFSDGALVELTGMADWTD